MTKIIEILYADSGSGHTSIAKAISAAIQDMGVDCSIRLVNGVDVSPRLFKGFTKSFLFVFHRAYWLYRTLYISTNNYILTRVMESLLGMFFGKEIQKYVASTDADLFISYHVLFNLVLSARVQSGAKYVGIINDPFSPHADNFSSRMDLCLVASAEARQIAIKQRVSQEKICLIGHPIQPEFLSISADKSEILKRVGSGEELPTVLVSGGGEGWGRIAGVVAALHVARLPIQLVVVCGHNRKLYERLNRREFTIPSRILGFISPKEMSALLQTAYLIVAKAGPNTIFEAFQAGLPTILFDVVRGQEEGNVDYICKHAAGFFCTSPRKVAKMVEALLTDRSLYKEISAHARSLATPTAAFDMAKVCYSLIECQPYES